jgi:hypothetical protein
MIHHCRNLTLRSHGTTSHTIYESLKENTMDPKNDGLDVYREAAEQREREDKVQNNDPDDD